MTDKQMRRLKPGDVIISPSGRCRTVFSATHHPLRTSVNVPILRCSWTHAGYTVIDRQMLKQYRVARKKRPPKATKLGRRLFQDCEKSTVQYKRLCTCCDVIGVLE